MRGVSREHAAQQIHRLAFGAHATAGLVMDRHHAVDVRVLRHEIFVEELGDGPANVGGAVDAGNHAQIVARGHTAVFADDALEGRRVGDIVDRLEIRTERVVALEIAHREVVHVHVVAGLDRLDRETDDLVVAAHG